jgi:hypothetical protein
MIGLSRDSADEQRTVRIVIGDWTFLLGVVPSPAQILDARA